MGDCVGGCVGGHCYDSQAGTVAGTVRALRGHCAGTVYSPSAAFPASYGYRLRVRHDIRMLV